jgi:hypothetical protein
MFNFLLALMLQQTPLVTDNEPGSVVGGSRVLLEVENL